MESGQKSGQGFRVRVKGLPEVGQRREHARMLDLRLVRLGVRQEERGGRVLDVQQDKGHNAADQLAVELQVLVGGVVLEILRGGGL